MALDKRDREEIERLAQRQLGFETDLMGIYDKAVSEGKLDPDREDVSEVIREQGSRVEYYQGLLRRVRAEYGPLGEAFGPLK